MIPILVSESNIESMTEVKSLESLQDAKPTSKDRVSEFIAAFDAFVKDSKANTWLSYLPLVAIRLKDSKAVVIDKTSDMPAERDKRDDNPSTRDLLKPFAATLADDGWIDVVVDDSEKLSAFASLLSWLDAMRRGIQSQTSEPVRATWCLDLAMDKLCLRGIFTPKGPEEHRPK